MKPAYRNNYNGVRGVHCNAKGRWIASISIAGKKKYLGSFDTIKQAQAVYEQARQQAEEEAHGKMLQASGP
jgi:hypothetical protein